MIYDHGRTVPVKDPELTAEIVRLLEGQVATAVDRYGVHFEEQAIEDVKGHEVVVEIIYPATRTFTTPRGEILTDHFLEPLWPPEPARAKMILYGLKHATTGGYFESLGIHISGAGDTYGANPLMLGGEQTDLLRAVARAGVNPVHAERK